MSEFSTKGYLDMELLRFTTAGSVDDGKSTLIGRLLYDSKSIFEDQLESVQRASVKKGSEYLDLALLTDGLRSEREQGITIDVAYRYFATPKRKFIIADTPGHIQYTRNMVTGASTANAALILIDARKGVIEQTLRHSYIASLLQIPHLIVCVNKMDLVDYSQEIYNKIVSDYLGFANKLGIKDCQFVPISALKGDNVVIESKVMNWYNGDTLLSTLEKTPIIRDYNHNHGRFPVQYVLRSELDNHANYKGYAGKAVAGVFEKGDEVKVYPSKITTKIQSIHFHKDEITTAFAPMSVSMTLEDDLDIRRGDIIVKENNNKIKEGYNIEMMMCWMNEKTMQLNGNYTVRHNVKETICSIKNIIYKVNINTFEKDLKDKNIMLNDIVKVEIATKDKLFYDSYNNNRHTGSLILIDEVTNETVGVGMII